MKDLYDSPVLAEWRDRKDAGTLTTSWLVDEGMPEVAKLLSLGHLHLEINDDGIAFRPVENGRAYYPVPKTMPGPYELFSHIIFSGGLDYGRQWWEEGEMHGVSEDGTVSPDWELPVTLGVALETDVFEGVLNTATLAQGIMRIASGDIGPARSSSPSAR